jgi:hypothetical protein
MAAHTLGKFGRPGESRPVIARREGLPPNVARLDAGIAPSGVPRAFDFHLALIARPRDAG